MTNLPRNLQQLQARVRAGEKFSYAFFWGHNLRAGHYQSGKGFSQWFAAPFELDGERFATAEHYMMAGKAALFDDQEMRRAILQSEDPGKAKALGRKVRNFDAQTWEAACCDIVYRGNLAKFSQHPRLRQDLLQSGDAIIVEASPKDAIWGIGLHAEHEHAKQPLRWPGRNLLGFVLMDVRAALRQNAD
ncbi:NADAR family protein [Massilia sp. W12]|uniref:NADAR family protein n=1 Tax=Massilia sp. W12 TaxID=3126507 RepID=UPI0030CF25CD